MIDAKVRDYRGCERADIEVDPIALVAGKNGSGKTSAAQAIGAVLTGEAMPPRWPRTMAGALVRASRDAGAATVQSSEGTGRIDWPACTRRTENKPPESSRWAAGLASVADLAPAERVKTLSEYLRAEPTRDDLRLALADHTELDAEAVTAAVWELIERNGWDGALVARRDRGAEFKGQWRQVTGANYGSRIAASWRQELDEERRTEAELVAAVDAARQEHERAVASSAVSGAERKRLQELAAEVTERNAAAIAAEKNIEVCEAELANAVAARQALPPADSAEAEIPCPSCGTLLNLRRSANLLDPPKLEVASTTPIPAADVKKRRLAIADADGKVAHERDALYGAQRARSEADVALQAAIEAGRELAALPPATEHQADTGMAREALDTAEAHLAAVKAKRQADAIAARIAANDKVIDLLAPDGLRARKLSHVVETFNSVRLGPLCAAASWRAVTIGDDLEIAFGGRHYALLSASEQFRVRVVLAVAMAQLDGSAMVVVDAADVLDGPARGDLFELLRVGGVPAIVAMTLARREQAPDLAAAGLGRTYWIEDGVTSSAQRQAVAA